MTDYNNDDLDDYEEVEETPVEEVERENGNGNGRNFWLALGILGGIFVLLVIALIIVFYSRQRGTDVTNVDIDATNAVIMTANAATANAATEAAAFLLTPSATPTATQTLLPTATSVLAIATASPTIDDKDTFATETAVAAGTTGPGIDRNTATVAALLTQQAPTFVAQTQAAGGRVTNTPAGARATNTPAGLLLTAQANTMVVQTQAAGGIATNTPGALPTAGFADDVGLPGLFGMALGLVLLIVLVRRLRLTTSG